MLAILQRLPKATGRLNPAQFWTLLGVWVSMIGFGFFIVDFGDSKDSEASAFSRLAGRATLDTSNTLSGIFFVLTIGLLRRPAGAADHRDAGPRRASPAELEQASGLSARRGRTSSHRRADRTRWSAGSGR